MHYIRLLKPPTQSRSGKRLLLNLVLTITTDLGDAYLFPDEPIDLTLVAVATNGSVSRRVELSLPTGTDKLQWRAGMRVLKPTIELPSFVSEVLRRNEHRLEFCIGTSKHSASSVNDILSSTTTTATGDLEADPDGLVMPLWVSLNKDEGNIGVPIRKLVLNGSGDELLCLELEEEMGESIARHIWDGGVTAFSAIANFFMLPTPPGSEASCLKSLKECLMGPKPLNILELGCGIGILGAGFSIIYPRMRPPARAKCTILMTDLEDAEGLARSNIARLQSKRDPRPTASSPARLLYENLDWEDGRNGKFTPEVQSRRWDLVMLCDCTYNVDTLPALVGTLSALHSSNMSHTSLPGEQSSTKVFLATKPRHSSERTVFDLLSGEGWTELHKQVLRLPVLGSEDQSVELYLFEKL